MRRAQWAAVAIAAAAVLVITVDTGEVPWIGLGLAFSFGLYGLIKKRAAAPVHPVASMTAETAVLLPVFVGGALWLAASGTLTTGQHGAGHFWIMAASGVVTAVPLIMFSTAAKTVPLSVLGILQYIAPIGQIGMQLLLPQQVGRPSYGRLLRATGSVTTWKLASCALSASLIVRSLNESGSGVEVKL